MRFRGVAVQGAGGAAAAAAANLLFFLDITMRKLSAYLSSTQVQSGTDTRVKRAFCVQALPSCVFYTFKNVGVFLGMYF